MCQEVDIGGLRGVEPNSTHSEDPYMRAVAEARILLRRFEAIAQSVYDDSSVLFVLAQSIPFSWVSTGNTVDAIGRQPTISGLYGSAKALKTEMSMAVDYLEKMMAIVREQVASEGRFRESMALRISRMSIMDGNRRLSQFFGPVPDITNEDEDVVDMDFAFRKGSTRPAMAEIGAFASDDADAVDSRFHHDSMTDFDQASMHKKSLSSSKDFRGDQELPDDDDFIEKGKVFLLIILKKPLFKDILGPTRATKIRKIFGEDAPERYIEIANADSKPWYLRSDHNKDEIVLNPDGGIRAGSMSALIERLTTHEYGGTRRYKYCVIALVD